VLGLLDRSGDDGKDINPRARNTRDVQELRALQVADSIDFRSNACPHALIGRTAPEDDFVTW